MASHVTAPPSPPPLQASPPSNDTTAYSSSSSSSPVSLILNALPWAKLSAMAIGVTGGSSSSSSSSSSDEDMFSSSSYAAAATAATTTLAAVLAAVLALVLSHLVLYGQGPSASAFVSNDHLPSVTPRPRRWWSWPVLDPAGVRTLRDFLDHAVDHMTEARDRFGPEAPYRMDTDNGEATMLPAARYAHEVRNDARLDFVGPLRKSMHYHLRGFDFTPRGGMANHLVVDVVRQDLTRELGKVTGPLTEETSFVLGLLLGEDTEYHEVELKSFVQELVARLSSRVFLGEELCRDRQWLDITVSCTITTMTASAIVRLFPWFLRPLINEVLPICRRMRAEQAKARDLILPIVARRRALRARLAASGASDAELRAAVKNDGIEWFERTSSSSTAKGGNGNGEARPYEPHFAQLTLSVAAIHTTSDLLSQVILDLARHGRDGGLLGALRAEVVEVLGREGWRKTSLYGLKLLDSCIRETQRLKPIGAASMRREVTADMTLSDGTLLRKGSQVMVTGLSHWDPTLYANPTVWDGYRFYNQAKQAQSQSQSQSQQSQQSHQTSQLQPPQQIAAVTTSADHLAFGHGAHACPGRFFAINEAKVALAHLIMKYDWELVDDSSSSSSASASSSSSSSSSWGGKDEKEQDQFKKHHKPIGFALIADQGARIRVRRRVAEIDLDALPVS